ncbi:MAG TPA: IPExxxVDY family protein [Anseongella sp.]
MNKKILRVNYDFDFTLIGIISPLRAYRLCWFLNNQLKMSLEREEDLSLRREPEEEVFFPRYFFYIEESETDFYVLGNRGTEGYLVPEQKEIDFFMLIYNLPGKDGGSDLIKKIKLIPEVQSAFLLDPGRLKSRENLLF